jgi:hypothetical protein
MNYGLPSVGRADLSSPTPIISHLDLLVSRSSLPLTFLSVLAKLSHGWATNKAQQRPYDAVASLTRCLNQ